MGFRGRPPRFFAGASTFLTGVNAINSAKANDNTDKNTASASIAYVHAPNSPHIL